MRLRAQNSEDEAKLLNEQLEDLKKQLDEVSLSLICMLVSSYFNLHAYFCLAIFLIFPC